MSRYFVKEKIGAIMLSKNMVIDLDGTFFGLWNILRLISEITK